MADQYNKKALMGAFGLEDEDDPLQQPGPVGGGVELPPPVAAPVAATAAPIAPPAGPDYRKPGKYTSTAYDTTKMQRPWEEMSEKYRIGTVLSNFDPSQGLTPEVIDALNKADIFGAKFSGAGDKLTVDNAGGYERFGKGGTSDVNIGFKTGKGTWGAWTDPELEAQAAQAAGGPMGGGGIGAAQSNLNGLLQGNPIASIQQAIEALMAGGNKPNLQALLQQLGGG